MSQPAELLASMEESLVGIAAEINQLKRQAEIAWQAYQDAKIWQARSAKNCWSAAVRREEAARQKKEELLAEKKALIEKLPAGGISAAESNRVSFPLSSIVWRACLLHLLLIKDLLDC